MSRPAFVAVDLGATSGRVMLAVVPDGARKVELTETGRFGNRARTDASGALRWDFDQLWAGILEGLRAAADEAAARGVTIRGIGVDSWAVDHGLLDAAGNLVDDPYCYRDPRTAGVPELVYSRVPFSEHYAVNGLQHLPFTTEFQVVAAALAATGTPPDTAWLRAAHLLLLPDLVTYRLTGRRVAEVTNASTTGLLDARTRTWAEEHIARLDTAFGLGGVRGRLADLVEPGTVVGPLLPEVASLTGLAGLAEVPVIAVASHDTASAVVATPLSEPRPGEAAAYISSGTWSLVGLELAAPVLTEESRAAGFTNELGLDGTVRYLHNVMGLWILDECVREWSASDAAAGAEAVDLPALLAAAGREPGGRCLVGVDGDEFLAPGDMPRRLRAAIGRAGAAVPDTRPALVRVILDSLADAYARAVRRAGELAGVRVTAVHVVGGGSRNTLLNELTAQATGLPVVAGPVEAAALGNALVQARAVGVLGGGLGVLRAVVRAGDELAVHEPGDVRLREPG